ncbi:MAG: hypothetical protein J5833_02505 [Victivallales bacterium]|nr:hypothetical protein [Victivallales bacterium]
MKTASKFSVVLLCLVCAIVQARPWIALFGSYECDECAAVKAEWAEEFNSPEAPVLVFLPIEHSPNYKLLGEIEKALEIKEKSTSFPTFLLGRRIIGDIEQFWELGEDIVRLANEAPDIPQTRQIRAAAEKADAPVITLKIAADSQKTQEVATIARLAFFEQKNCAKCSRQEKELEILQKSMPNLTIDRFDAADAATAVMLTRFHKRFNVLRTDKNLIPMVCWSDGFITGRLAEAEELQSALSKGGSDCFWLPPASAEELAQEESRQQKALEAFKLPLVIGAALLDGINPCAFATTLFLISYLLMKRRRRRDIVIVGLSFCAGVFVAYFLYGLGLSFLIDFLGKFKWIKAALYILFAVVSAVLAVMHLRDAMIFRRTGKSDDMDMGLSKEMHRGIHDKIRRFLECGSWLLAPAAFVLGMVVSSMEFACTGQVYLPIIATILSRGLTTRALIYLIIYNVCFILPLLLVTAVALKGAGIKAFSEWARNHVFGTKVTMAVVFALIAVIMLLVILI